jgi:hypothetical protein
MGDGSSLRSSRFYVNDFSGREVETEAVMLCFHAEPVEPSASIFKPSGKTPPIEQPIKRALVEIVLAVHDLSPCGAGAISRYV